MKGRKKNKAKWWKYWKMALTLILILGVYGILDYTIGKFRDEQPETQVPAFSVETETEILEGQLTSVSLEHDTIVSITIDNTSFRPFVVRVQPYPKNFESSALVSTSTTDKESQQNVIHYSFNQLGSMLTIYYDGTMQQFVDERIKAKE
ncbi:MAG: hypothetical protein ABS904_00250 [Solibacillus isronensis]